MLGIKAPKVFFLHVPKCGGISVDTAFRRKYRPSQVFRLEAPPSARAADAFFAGLDVPRDQYFHVLRLREALLAYAIARKPTRYISGHFAFSERIYDELGRGWAFVTVLRDPVSRWLSHYLYNRYKDRPGRHCGIDDEIEEVLVSGRGRSWGNEYVKYYGGLREDGEYRSDEAIEDAVENLRRFSAVGRLEKLDGFVAQVRDSIGLSLSIPRKNRSPVSPELKKEMVTESIRSRLREVCAPDLEVYQSAAR
ncbi:MAG: hypothetical protein R6V85_03230 [Polyangia bacterium]